MPIINNIWRLTLPALAIAIFALAAPAPTAAQATAEQPLPPQDLSQSQLESFAAAATRVGAITEQLQVEAQGVETEEELARLQEEAHLEMINAVENEGLTVEEYNMIFQVAQVDPEVNAMVMQMLQR